MEFLVANWLTQRQDEKVKPNFAQAEAILVALYDALDQEDLSCAWDIIQSHEMSLLNHRLATSSQQETRFWFLIAQYHTLKKHARESAEAYNLCNQVCPRTDYLALLEIHHDWGFLALREESYSQAIRCFSTAIALTEQPKLRKLPYLMYTDAEGLLYCLYLHRAFLAQKIGQFDLANHDLQTVANFVTSWTQSRTTTILNKSSSHILQALSTLQATITGTSEVVHQSWGELFAEMKPCHLPPVGQF